MDSRKTGELIAMRRKKLGFTQQQLAFKLKVSDKAVSKWECGDGFPDVTVLLDLSEILGISADALLRGECHTEHTINTVEDVFRMLDDTVYEIPWNSFYEKRVRPAPFLHTPDLPDENLVKFIKTNKGVHTALELGCGEGRNAITMAKRNINVTAIDSSHIAITNAISKAKEQNTSVKFFCSNIFDTDFKSERYDFVYDSGLLHHLAPHRRISYLSLLNEVLEPGGFFGLTCFSWGDHCADEVDDWEFYQKRRAGVAFTKDRLIELFGKQFDIMEIRKYDDHVPDTLHGTPFLWACLFQMKK